MPNRDKHSLLAILDAIQTIETALSHTDSSMAFSSDRIVFDAVLMNFIVIGEMAKRLHDEIKQHHPHIKWDKISDFRNIIAHDYLGVDADEVWQIIRSDLPTLRTAIQSMLLEIH